MNVCGEGENITKTHSEREIHTSDVDLSSASDAEGAASHPACCRESCRSQWREAETSMSTDAAALWLHPEIPALKLMDRIERRATLLTSGSLWTVWLSRETGAGCYCHCHKTLEGSTSLFSLRKNFFDFIGCSSLIDCCWNWSKVTFSLMEFIIQKEKHYFFMKRQEKNLMWKM